MASYSLGETWMAMGTWLCPMHSSPSPRRNRVIIRVSSSVRFSFSWTSRASCSSICMMNLTRQLSKMPLPYLPPSSAIISAMP